MREPATVRLFIALWPPDAVRDALAAWQGQWQWPQRASVVRPERMHLTLHFLGNVPPQIVADLNYVLRRVPCQTFALQFGQADMWPHGTAVLRPDQSPTALRGLHARIGLALSEIGLKAEDRAFRPHVTLARRAQGATPPEAAADIAWESKAGFVLVQTLGGGRGYQVLENFGA